MTNLNKYNIYSAISSSEIKNNDEMEYALKLIEKLDTLANADNVKHFLDNELNVTNGRYNEKGCIITTKDNKEALVVNLSFKNENYVYYFNK